MNIGGVSWNQASTQAKRNNATQSKLNIAPANTIVVKKDQKTVSQVSPIPVTQPKKQSTIIKQL